MVPRDIILRARYQDSHHQLQEALCMEDSVHNLKEAKVEDVEEFKFSLSRENVLERLDLRDNHQHIKGKNLVNG